MAAKTVTRKRAVLYNALDYAVELKALSANNLGQVKWSAPKTVRAVDKRVAINVGQAERLLDVVSAQRVAGQPRRSSGPRLRAFFAVMYYAALRPEEAAMRGKSDLQLPADGWGELLLSETAPIAGAAWTDSGEGRDRRQLKQRGVSEVRAVPSPPPLARILHEHLAEFGTAADGRLFRSLDGGALPESTVARVWDKARREGIDRRRVRLTSCAPAIRLAARVRIYVAGGRRSLDAVRGVGGAFRGGAAHDLREGHLRAGGGGA